MHGLPSKLSAHLARDLIQFPVQRYDLQVSEVILKKLRVSDVRGPLEQVDLVEDKIADFMLEAGNGQDAPGRGLALGIGKALALAYHEGRNVRHLLRNRLVESNQLWQKLVQLPKNRYDAWRQISPLFEMTRTAPTPDRAVDIFVCRFGVTPEDLTTMFANENWRHANAYGGNAWARIADLTIALGDALKSADEESSDTIGSKLLSASHNTGSLQQEFLELNQALAHE